MSIRNVYINAVSRKKAKNAAQRPRNKALFLLSATCMLIALLFAQPAFSQSSTSRSSAVFAGASPFQDSLWTMNVTDYQIVKRLAPSLSGFTITGINGIATHPATGEDYCILKLSGVTGRVLAKINIQTGVCTQIGNLGDNFSSLAFNANGTLFGVTGDGASVPETMYRINLTDASKTLFRTLGNGADGEVICYNTDDNKFYHWSGNGTVVFERFDTTGIDVIENLTFSGISNGEVFGAYYIGGNDFLVSNISSTLRTWELTGTNAAVGAVLVNTPDDLRGLVRESHVSTVSTTASTAICPGSGVTISVTGGTGNYQWYMNGSPISGQTNATYVATAAGNYNAQYDDINGINGMPGDGIDVTVLPSPGIAIVPNPQVCFGATSTGITYSNAMSYSATGSSSTYVVPLGVTSINFDIKGAAGGNDSSAAPMPGRGGRLTGVLAVTAGDVLTLTAGGMGNTGTITGAAGGFNGGGSSWSYGGSGGGATDIRLNGTSLANRVAVAGGGAGSGYSGTLSIFGGAGGDLTAGNGGENAEASAATGGTQLAGGAGASFSGFGSGDNGMLGMGGNSSVDGVSGAGGGGYFGGGGGAWSGGGGGSSYSNPLLVSGITHFQGANPGAGQIDISYPIPATYTYSIVWGATALAAGFTHVTSSAFPTTSFFPVTIPTTASPDTYTGTLIINDGTCTYSQPISVTVKPIPTVNAVSNQILCNNESTTDVVYTGSLSGTTYNWTNSNTSIGLAAAGSGDIMSFVANNSTAANQVANITVTPTLNGCSGPSETFSFTVKPTPTLSSATLAGYVCDNAPFNYTASSAVASTSFAWSRDAYTGGITAAPASGTNTIAETFNNTSTNPIPVVYTFTLTANGCSNTQFVTVTVNPTPEYILTPLVGTICSGDNVSFDQGSFTSGLLHTWSRAAVTGITPGATSGTGFINEVLTNTTPNPITVGYVDTMNINGCKYTQALSVVVNPMPVLSTPLTGNICNGATYDYNPASLTAGTTISWNRPFVSGITSSGPSSGNDTINETHTNATVNPINVNYFFTLSANGCTNFQTVTVTVNSTPVLNTTLTPAAVCDSTIFSYIPGSNTIGATFAWSRAAVANITNPAATGTGNPNERLRNAASFPVPVTYVFTTSINGCTNTENVVVTVNPRPRLSNTAPLPICDSTVFTFVPTSMVLGYSYSWSRAFVSGIGSLPDTGTGNINERHKNNTNTNITVNYVFNITANGCTHIQNVAVMVHPKPTLSSSLLDSACSGSPFVYTPTTDIIPTLSYAWSRASVTGITPANGAGSGAVNETLINGTTNTLDIVYVYTMTVGASCTNQQNVRVKVRPAAEAPLITIMPGGGTMCNGTMYQNFGAAAAPAGVTYKWSAVNAEVYATGTGNQNSIVNFNVPSSVAQVMLSSTIGATGCTGVATYTVNVSNVTSTMPKVIYTNGTFICLQNDVKSFQWGYDDAATLDSTILTGEVNQSYFIKATPNFAGRHYWVMTNSGDCMQKAYYNAPNDNTPRVINDVTEGATTINVFPNPTSENINVEVTTAAAGAIEVQLVNMLGQVLNTVNADANKATINVANLPGGFYMVDCYQNGMKIGTSKFVKN
ncbi:MAG: T9SS type A sorting domain-containing protein [Taibaiella sp.]|nr:T9SS type A sorting domain-containing protein [Taibaiella sp.]